MAALLGCTVSTTLLGHRPWWLRLAPGTCCASFPLAEGSVWPQEGPVSEATWVLFSPKSLRAGSPWQLGHSSDAQPGCGRVTTGTQAAGRSQSTATGPCWKQAARLIVFWEEFLATCTVPLAWSFPKLLVSTQAYGSPHARWCLKSTNRIQY